MSVAYLSRSKAPGGPAVKVRGPARCSCESRSAEGFQADAPAGIVDARELVEIYRPTLQRHRDEVLSPAPWILKDLLSLGVVDANWAPSWVAVRERNYVYEFKLGSRRLIVKSLRYQSADSATTAGFLSNEVRILTLLQGHHKDARIPKLAPRPVAGFASKGIWVQECLPGFPLRSGEFLSQPLLQQRVIERLLSLRAVGSGGLLGYQDLMKELRTDPSASSEVRHYHARAVSEALAGKLQPCLGHNDLNPSNILVDDGDVSFADWTFSQDRDIPGFDWFDLLTYVHLEVSGYTWRALAEGFASGTSRAIADYLQGAAKLVGCMEVSRNLLRLYFSTRFANLLSRYEADRPHSVIASLLESESWLQRV